MIARSAPVGNPQNQPRAARVRPGLFAVTDLGPVAIDDAWLPLQSFSVEDAIPTETRFQGLHGYRLTPFVGREHEIGLLETLYRRAELGEGQIALISGEPGIGKSRLTRSLIERLADEPHTRLRYHCSSYHTNSALYL